VKKSPSFESEEYTNHVYKLQKMLHGIKQALRAWYDCLRDFLIENGFRIGKTDSTLFTKKVGKDLFVC
jgi:phage host-nuclease inhibitor protein Gam